MVSARKRGCFICIQRVVDIQAGHQTFTQFSSQSTAITPQRHNHNDGTTPQSTTMINFLDPTMTTVMLITHHQYHQYHQYQYHPQRTKYNGSSLLRLSLCRLNLVLIIWILRLQPFTKTPYCLHKTCTYYKSQGEYWWASILIVSFLLLLRHTNKTDRFTPFSSVHYLFPCRYYSRDFDATNNMFVAHSGWYNDQLIHYYCSTNFVSLLL